MEAKFTTTLAVVLVFLSLATHGWAESVHELGVSGFESTIRDTDVVLVNFYANWCKFSRQLQPIFEDTAKSLRVKYPDEKKLKLVRVDCEKEVEVAKKYGVNKYPTIKMFKNGKAQKREYRGQRSPEAITEFIDKQMESPVKRIPNLDDLDDLLDKRKPNMIGYFDREDQAEFLQFDKVAGMLREDCGWFTAFGDVSAPQRPGGGYQIVFKPPNAEHQEKLYSSSLKSHELFLNWATDKCVPLVRTITFENAEELTEEGLPFLILFTHPEDTTSAVKYTEVVHKQLIREKETVNFLVADGIQFAHPLHHMGKSAKDLPILAIDSFKHMYVFPDKERMFDPPALIQFIKDLQSGKLHREFHHGPDTTQPPAIGQGEVRPQDPIQQVPRTPDQPPESQFAKLKPSDMRYSFKDYRDEL